MTDMIQVNVTRGGHPESAHQVVAAVWQAETGLVESWGAIDTPMFPRSSSKMIQALPLVESGAAEALNPAQLALACASHRGAAIHTDRVLRWLGDLNLSEADLRCGTQMPNDETAAHDLIRRDIAPGQCHNNCSGKHTGFLTLSRHLAAGGAMSPDYVDPDHPVQRAVLAAWEETTDETSPGFGIDGCSAPNHLTTLQGLARAMSSFAAAADGQGSGARPEAQRRLVAAMTAHPELVSGEDGTCTALMRAMEGRGAAKTGAEGVYVAILPEKRLGIAVKARCGTTRAAEAAIAALLCRHGALDPAHPTARALKDTVLKNRADIAVGAISTHLP